MKLTAPLVVVLVALGAVAGSADAERVIYSAAFDAAAIAPDWRVVEGDWSIADSALTNTGGGLIVLDKPLGSRFDLEAEISFPPNWASLILFYVNPEAYGTLYFTGGYWESFEIDETDFSDYIQHRDTGITAGVYHRVRAVCEYGRVTLYYDGQLKGEISFRPRPGSRLALRNIKGGGPLQVRTVRVTEPPATEVRVVRRLQESDLAKAGMWADYHLSGKPDRTRRLSGDLAGGVGLSYSFEPGPTFQSEFARLPLEAPKCAKLLVDVDGDGSGNTLFIILHDRSGEQHLVATTVLEWQGRQELAVNFSAFLDAPTDRQRLHTHWGGDENQTIDFPISAIDIGVAKRPSRTEASGEVKLRELRLLE
jgi:hypothetical protein